MAAATWCMRGGRGTDATPSSSGGTPRGASSWESGKSGTGEKTAAEGSSGYERAAGELPLALVDWEEAYLDLVKHRGIKGMRPLAVLRADALRSLVENAPVTVSADEHVFTPRRWHDREELQAIVHSVLRRCADKCWQSERRRWEGERMNYREVTGTDPNLLLNVDPAATPDADPEPYDDLRPKYGDGSWTRDDFARRHILFRDAKRKYIEVLLAGGLPGRRDRDR